MTWFSSSRFEKTARMLNCRPSKVGRDRINAAARERTGRARADGRRAMPCFVKLATLTNPRSPRKSSLEAGPRSIMPMQTGDRRICPLGGPR
jgi:hypothetical protein